MSETGEAAIGSESESDAVAKGTSSSSRAESPRRGLGKCRVRP